MTRLLPLLLTLAVAAVGALPASASADALVAPAPGAVNLTAGGGWMAWAAPGEDSGWRLVVRSPAGEVTTPAIEGFSSPPRASIGSGAPPGPGRRPLVAVYERDGDIFALDLATGRERRVPIVSSSAYRESLPSVQYGSYVFVRSGGRRNGIHFASGRTGTVRRVLSTVPRLLASNGTRFAYVTRNRVTIRRLSGEGAPLLFRLARTPRDLYLTRYRAGWLEGGGRVFETSRFGGSSDPSDVPEARSGARSLPSGAQSIALERDRLSLFLDGEGVKRAAPRPFP